ncbi:hypothetical protein [Halocatena pleomorpha]|uniref:Uncharacterized protein n=1 Tax=Halocatena pleomorpha TaxID=1785090 RepID=A0A3P3R7S2_9EURY|nr:hypothetical protein [Halocatena pleomorpha]RRJ29511.1 hypothetical protein EIK79_12805 [Halocatena pleomorpha]
MAVAGCVGHDPEPPSGQLTAGEQTRSPIRDRTLSGGTRSWSTAQFSARNIGFDPALSEPAVTHARVKWHPH